MAFDRQADGGIIRHAGTSGCVSNGGQRRRAATGRGLAGRPAAGARAPTGCTSTRQLQRRGGRARRSRASGGLSPRARTSAAACSSPRPRATASRASRSRTGSESPSRRTAGRSMPRSRTPTRSRSTSATARRRCARARGVAITAGQSVRLTLPCSDADGDALTRTLGDPPALGEPRPDRSGHAGRSRSPPPAVPGTTSVPVPRDLERASTPTPRVHDHGQCRRRRRRRRWRWPERRLAAAPTPLTILPSTTSINSLGFKKFTKLVNLSVKNLAAGSTVTVTCKTKKKSQQKKGCAYKKQALHDVGRAREAQPAQAVRQEARAGRHEDHDHDRRARLHRQADPVHGPRGQDPEVARALHPARRQGRQLRLSGDDEVGRRRRAAPATSAR